MPKRTRDHMLWGIAKVCEETSMSRTNVEFLMEAGYIKSFRYVGELVTNEEEVQAFITGCITNRFGEIRNGMNVIISGPARHDDVPQPVQRPSAPSEAEKNILAAIDSIRKKNGMPPKQQNGTRQKRGRKKNQATQLQSPQIGSNPFKSAQL